MMESMEKRTILELRGLCRRINSEFYLHDIDLTLREGGGRRHRGAQRLG